MKLYFITINNYKKREVKEYLRGENIDLKFVKYRINPILDFNLKTVVEDKVLKAYEFLRKPCAVEHSSLEIQKLKRLPAGLSNLIWNKVKDGICGFIKRGGSRITYAKSIVGYCDGRKIITFSGSTKGKISYEAKGEYNFHWDPIFIPDGDNRTFGEMGFPEKKEYSPSYKAWKKLIRYINTLSNDR